MKKEIAKQKQELGYQPDEELKSKYEKAIEYLTKCQQDREQKVE